VTAGGRSCSPPFRERIRLARTKRYEDWWHIVFGGPLGALLVAIVAPVRWITPNALTILSFALKLAACPMIYFGHDLAAVAMLQGNVLLDAMDGSLARYRDRPSLFGALLDKVTDSIGLIAVFTVIGYRVSAGDGGAALPLLAGAWIGVGYLLRCYAFWVVKAFEIERDAPPSIGMVRADFGDLGFGARMRYYAASTWRIALFGEADLYLWASIGLLLGRESLAIYTLSVAMTLWVVVALGARFYRAYQLDRAAEAES
jgi:phosphatidylglycerophosphate synthase